MSAPTIDAARLTDNPIGELVLPTSRPATRTSVLAGYNNDYLTLGMTATSYIKDDNFVARALTN
jgi:hypothetical protein